MKVIDWVNLQKNVACHTKTKKCKRILINDIYRKFVLKTSTATRLTDWSTQISEKNRAEEKKLKLQALHNKCSKPLSEENSPYIYQSEL